MIQAHEKQGSALGISGTPSFVIGRSTKEGVDGALYVGALPYASYEDAFKRLGPPGGPQSAVVHLP